MQTGVEAQVRVHAGVWVHGMRPHPPKKNGKSRTRGRRVQHPSQTRPQSRSQSEAETPRHHAVVDVKASPLARNGRGFVGVCASLLALLLWLFNLDHVIDAQNGDGSLGGEGYGLALAHGWLDHACREAVVDGARPAPDFSCQVR
jgi:hypothetical protein